MYIESITAQIEYHMLTPRIFYLVILRVFIFSEGGGGGTPHYNWCGVPSKKSVQKEELNSMRKTIYIYSADIMDLPVIVTYGSTPPPPPGNFLLSPLPKAPVRPTGLAPDHPRTNSPDSPLRFR